MLSFCIFSLFFSSIDIYASETVKARIGNQFFDTLEEAILHANSTEVIYLTSDIVLEDTLEINKTVNINLNNKIIESEEKVFLIQGGSLNLTGNGKIREIKPNYGAITLIGSNDETDENYSTVSVGSEITLEGWSGIFITHENYKSYGILVNMDGKINAVDDVEGGPGVGVYVNGNVKHQNNFPIINLSKTSKIISTGTGIYSAGYATYNINGAYISGEDSGLAIKSGVFNILDGTIIGTGDDKTPTSGNNNGINPSGTAIQIESNKGYEGNIELYIKNGILESKKGHVIYEYTVNNSNTSVKNIAFSGGKYISDANKNVFLLSDSFLNNHSKFITGGNYSSDPSNYLESGYSAIKNENNLYEVVSSTVSVFATKESKNKNSSIILIVSIVIIFILSIIAYFNKNKILKIFK